MPETADGSSGTSGSGAAAPSGVHHGWLVVATASVVFFFQSGMGGYILGSLQPFWLSEFGWPKTWFASAFAIGSLVPGLTGVLVGRLVDRYGPRWPVVLGALATGLSLAFLSTVHSFVFFCLAFGGIAFGRSGMSNIPVATAITQWFVTRRARAMTIATAGISLAGVVLVPLTTWLALSFGWRTAVVVIGAAICVCIIPPVWFVLDRSPAQRGMRPYGADETHVQPTGGRVSANLGAVMRTPVFWLVTVSQMVVTVGLSSIGIHIQQALIDRGVSPLEASAAVSFLALCSASSRILYSWMDNLLPSPLLIACSYVMCALGWIAMAFAGPDSAIYLFPVVLGIGVGGALSLQSVVVADIFGAQGYGAILGAVTTPAAVVLAAGPLMAAGVRDVTGEYRGAFLGFAVLSLVGTALIVLAHRRAVRDRARHQAEA